MLLPLVGTVGPAQAADPEVVFSITPLSGLVGTKITFAGTGCVRDPAKTSDGVVFLAREVHLDRPVAIKLLPPDRAAFASRPGRFSPEHRGMPSVRRSLLPFRRASHPPSR